MKYLLIILVASIAILSIQAQDDIPYIYYYSRLYGGIIIERADGTDSRIIGQDIIPPSMQSISGAGWSPNGKYFAGRYFVIDLQGNNRVPFMNEIVSMKRSQWSPDGQYFLVIGNTHEDNTNLNFVWLFDPESGEIVVEAGFHTESTIYYSLGEINWYIDDGFVDIYFASYKLVQMSLYFDGTVIQKPISQSEFQQHYHRSEPVMVDYFMGDLHSPSGNYVIRGGHRQTLTKTDDNTISLPLPSLYDSCRFANWHISEMFVFRGFGVGDCSYALLTIVSVSGDEYRELGYCNGVFTICFGWLPNTVLKQHLPEGNDNSVILQPFDYEEDFGSLAQFKDENTNGEYRCLDRFTRQILDKDTGVLLYTLQDPRDCPTQNSFNGVIASDSATGLLAISYPVRVPYRGVEIYNMSSGVGEFVDRIQSLGVEMEFTGADLRLKNVYNWKIYSVADILAHAQNSPITKIVYSEAQR